SRSEPAKNPSRLKLLAGAISPILSPCLSERGFMSLVLAKELSLAHQLGRSTQKNFLAGPAYHLRSTRSVHLYRRVHPAGGDRCHGRSARACAGRLCLAHAALVKAHVYFVLALPPHKLHVDAVLEVVMAADLRALALPRWRK